MIIDIADIAIRTEAQEEARRMLQELREGRGDWSYILKLEEWNQKWRSRFFKAIGISAPELERLRLELRLRIALETISARRNDRFRHGTIIDHFAIRRAIEDGVRIEDLQLTDEEISEVEEEYGSLEKAAKYSAE